MNQIHPCSSVPLFQLIKRSAVDFPSCLLPVLSIMSMFFSFRLQLMVLQMTHLITPARPVPAAPCQAVSLAAAATVKTAKTTTTTTMVRRRKKPAEMMMMNQAAWACSIEGLAAITEPLVCNQPGLVFRPTVCLLVTVLPELLVKDTDLRSEQVESCSLARRV